MRKKNATDLLRFYGGDIREKTEDGIMIVSGNVMADELWGDNGSLPDVECNAF